MSDLNCKNSKFGGYVNMAEGGGGGPGGGRITTLDNLDKSEALCAKFDYHFQSSKLAKNERRLNFGAICSKNTCLRQIYIDYRGKMVFIPVLPNVYKTPRFQLGDTSFTSKTNFLFTECLYLS